MKYAIQNALIQIPHHIGKMVIFFFVFSRMPLVLQKIEQVKNVIQFKRHHASWMPIFLFLHANFIKMEFRSFTCQCKTIVRSNRFTSSDNSHILFDLIFVCKVFWYARKKNSTNQWHKLTPIAVSLPNETEAFCK